MSCPKGYKMPPRSEEHRRKIRERMLGNTINVGRVFSESRNEKIAEKMIKNTRGSANKGRTDLTEFLCTVLAKANKERMKGNTYWKFQDKNNPLLKKKLSEAGLKNWANPVYKNKQIKKIMDGLCKLPNGRLVRSYYLKI